MALGVLGITAATAQVVHGPAEEMDKTVLPAVDATGADADNRPAVIDGERPNERTSEAGLVGQRLSGEVVDAGVLLHAGAVPHDRIIGTDAVNPEKPGTNVKVAKAGNYFGQHVGEGVWSGPNQGVGLGAIGWPTDAAHEPAVIDAGALCPSIVALTIVIRRKSAQVDHRAGRRVRSRRGPEKSGGGVAVRRVGIPRHHSAVVDGRRGRCEAGRQASHNGLPGSWAPKKRA